MLAEFSSLLPLIRKRRRSYIAGVTSLLVTSGAQLLLPQFIRQAVDTLMEGGDRVTQVGRILLLMIAVAVLVAIGRLGWRYFIHGASRRIEAELREKIYHHLLDLPASYFDEMKTGDLMARATNDLNAIRMAVGMALVAFIDGLFMSVAILVILFSQNARLAAFTVIPLPLITLGIVLVGRRVGKLFRQVQEGFSSLTDQTQEVLSGIRVVKAFVKERYFLDRFAEANDVYQNRNLRLVKLWGLLFPTVTFLSGITLLLLIIVGGRALIDGEITTGEFVATLSYLQMLIWPVLGAGFTVNMLQRGAASMGRINEILNAPVSIASPPDAHTTRGGADVQLRSLGFTYGADGPAILEDVSFSVNQGEYLGIFGGTGSGKSTLLHTLPRVIDPPEGTVFVGGVDVRRYDLTTLRSSFGFVPQAGFLFSATILENIRFGRPEASLDEIEEIVQRTALDGDLSGFPQGWDTVVGERGVTLSGGQQQRVAIARALLTNPPILVLDDALSAVDAQTEERILRGVLEARQGKTTIVVSNRVSTFETADQVIVLEHGRITHRGRHDELITKKGLYQEIFDLQRLERAEETR